MTIDQARKAEVLKFVDSLRRAGVTKVKISYGGEGDEGRVEAAQFHDCTDNAIHESRLVDLDIVALADLLEGFAPPEYENDEGGFGTVTFDVESKKIQVAHNWYERVSWPAEPREV